jgi:CRISPR/Cas system-associated exonuclease Cas4 (RecB family)
MKPPTWRLIELHVRVPYGLVIYKGQQVRRVEFNDASRKWLLEIIAEVQQARNDGVGIRNHNHKGRCAGCGVRAQCDQALL